MRLVEICVDAGLESTMHGAQAQLADAYLVVGAGLEARVIAEDLVAREPWEQANIERFRRALTLLGETEIDAIIAERLSGQSPFTSTDFAWPPKPAAGDAAAKPASERAACSRDRAAAGQCLTGTGSGSQRGASRSARAALSAARKGSDADRDGLKGSSRRNGQRRVSGSGGAAPEACRCLHRNGVARRGDESARGGVAFAATSVPCGGPAGESVSRPRRPTPRGRMVRACGGGCRPVPRGPPCPPVRSRLRCSKRKARAPARWPCLLELQANAGEYRDVSMRLEQLKVQMGS